MSKWIQRIYPENSASRQKHLERLQQISRSEDDGAQKTDGLHKLFSEAFISNGEALQSAGEQGIILSEDKTVLIKCPANVAFPVIPPCVSVIGDKAFERCVNLEKLKIPAGVTSIGDEAFAGCTNLSSIILPDTLESIGDRAFSECYKLTAIDISVNVGRIGDGVLGDPS